MVGIKPVTVRLVYDLNESGRERRGKIVKMCFTTSFEVSTQLSV